MIMNGRVGVEQDGSRSQVAVDGSAHREVAWPVDRVDQLQIQRTRLRCLSSLSSLLELELLF